MYLRSNIAAFILAGVLSLQVIPSYAHTQSEIDTELMPHSDWISRVYPDLTSCKEKNNWRPLSGWLCSDYEHQKWCENGIIGSKWVNGWNFSVDINGLDARDVCPICGGNENSVPKSCQQYRGDSIVYWFTYVFDLNTKKDGCEGAIEYLTNILGLKREIVCDTLVDSIVEKMVPNARCKDWVRMLYNTRGMCIDRFSTKFSDICGCSCSS